MIRQATENDLNDILTIYNDAILTTTATYDCQIQTIEERKLWFANKAEHGYSVLVYEESNRVVGFTTYGPFRTKAAYKYTIEHSVYVRSEFRGRGIGTVLLKELIKHAQAKEYATLIAAIDADNENSIKIHEKLGFHYAGTIKRAGYKFGKWLDLAFYQLALAGPRIPTED